MKKLLSWFFWHRWFMKTWFMKYEYVGEKKVSKKDYQNMMHFMVRNNMFGSRSIPLIRKDLIGLAGDAYWKRFP